MLATSTADAGVTLERLALEGTKQMRPGAAEHFRSVAAHFVFGANGRERDRLRRDRNLGEGHPADVRSNAESREIFV